MMLYLTGVALQSLPDECEALLSDGSGGGWGNWLIWTGMEFSIPYSYKLYLPIYLFIYWDANMAEKCTYGFDMHRSINFEGTLILHILWQVTSKKAMFFFNWTLLFSPCSGLPPLWGIQPGVVFNWCPENVLSSLLTNQGHLYLHANDSINSIIRDLIHQCIVTLLKKQTLYTQATTAGYWPRVY